MSANTQHTKAPWAVKISHGIPSSVVGGEYREFANGTAQQQLAAVCCPDDENGGTPAWGANAALIAAAPELFDIAMQVIDGYGNMDFDIQSVARQARAVVLRATAQD